MRGQLSIGSHHGSIFIFMVYFSTNTYTRICSCNLSIVNRGSNSPVSLTVTMETKLKKSCFQEMSGIFRCHIDFKRQ